MALTRNEVRQRRWVKTRIGYLESDNARIVKSLSDRISALEDLLVNPTRSTPLVDGDPVVQDVGLTAPERSEDALPAELVDCDGCQKRYHFRGWSLDELLGFHNQFHL